MRWPTSNGITGCLGTSLGPAYLANPEIRVEKYERDMNRHLGLLREEILQQKSVKKWAQSSLALRQVWHWAKRQPRIQSFGVLLGEEPGRKPNVHQSLRIMEVKCEDAFVEHFFLSLHELIVTKFSMKKRRWQVGLGQASQDQDSGQPPSWPGVRRARGCLLSAIKAAWAETASMSPLWIPSVWPSLRFDCPVPDFLWGKSQRIHVWHLRVGT